MKIEIKATPKFTTNSLNETLLNFAKLFFNKNDMDISIQDWEQFNRWADTIIREQTDLHTRVSISVDALDYKGVDVDSDTCLYIWDFYKSSLDYIVGREQSNTELKRRGWHALRVALEDWFDNGELFDIIEE